MSAPACADCRFLKPYTGEQQNVGAKVIGECRRRAPEFNRTSVYARWPEVTEHGWCGEFVSKTAEPVDDSLIARIADLAESVAHIARGKMFE